MSLTRQLSASVIVLSLSMSAATVHANPWGEVARGFEAFGYQFNGQRNIFGDGWDINMTAVYPNQRDFNFGVADLKIGPGISNIKMGYTLLGGPQAHFSWDTGGMALPYTFKINNGIQDYTATGNLAANVSTNINLLGFYDMQVQISNRGTWQTNGFTDNSNGPISSDIGPINISGNIYADLLAAVTQPFFAATNTENPFAKFSSRAARLTEVYDSIEEMNARVEAGGILTDAEMSQLADNILAVALLGGDSNLDGMLNSLTQASEQNAIGLKPATAPVPEPTALLLSTTVGGILLTIRKRSK